MTKKLKQALYNIAQNNSYAIKLRGDLDIRYNDSQDFIEVSVWGIRKMLEEAYLLGRKAGTKNG